MLSMLMALSGSDILGGAGQLETATAVSPLQLIIDDEILATIRHTVSGISLDDDQLAFKKSQQLNRHSIFWRTIIH